ncbi:type I restriction enzyme, S subunit [Loktanella fryxellensis]|uniref:Type I restriction enzyme, S subunit n=1 Tax=Loktanella fryxellensis TaxID=245187 RepID=A0A1H8HZK2_9RHOB|nr:restriction endonuclease subunit S [Loktanella fryxellensis]SEN61572.1 type I restriction enzyme, S subunit [Loktanella fryxellensis]
MTDLPVTWANATLKELIAHDGIFTDGDWVESKDQDPNGSVRLIQLADIADSRFVNKSSRFLTRERAGELNCTFLRKGDLLVARMPDPLGRCCLFPLEGDERFVTVVDVCAIRLGSASIEPRYLMRAINSPSVRGMISALQSGSTRKRISRGNLATVPIPIPPLNEQRRIVEKIEAQFDEIGKGVESLQTARATLSLYRQSLLKSAFEGRLTADWRAQNADKLETPETLLARIQAERDIRYKAALDAWQTALTKWRADGEKVKKPAKPKRLALLDTVPAPFAIPADWFVLSVGSLGRVETGATPPTKSKENFGGDIPFFKPTDLEAGVDVREAREFLSEIGAEKSRPFSAGSILVTCIGATIGKTGLAGVDAACNQQINYIEPDPNFEPRFIYYQTISPFFQDQIKDNASSTTLPILNKGKFSKLPAIICSPTEQAKIVQILDARLDAAARLETEIDAALTRADALRQSILKKAFSGQLVPQDPDDEPASVLLERIKVEKAERERDAKRDRKLVPTLPPKTRRPTLTDLIKVLEQQKTWISASKAAQELNISDGASSDDVETFYRQLKEYVEGGDIEVERRGDEDWLRIVKAEVA